MHSWDGVFKSRAALFIAEISRDDFSYFFYQSSQTIFEIILVSVERLNWNEFDFWRSFEGGIEIFLGLLFIWYELLILRVIRGAIVDNFIYIRIRWRMNRWIRAIGVIGSIISIFFRVQIRLTYFHFYAQSIPFFPIVMIKDLTLGDLNLVSIRNVALNQSIEIKIYLSFRIDARISSSPVTNR